MAFLRLVGKSFSEDMQNRWLPEKPSEGQQIFSLNFRPPQNLRQESVWGRTFLRFVGFFASNCIFPLAGQISAVLTLFGLVLVGHSGALSRLAMPMLVCPHLGQMAAVPSGACQPIGPWNYAKERGRPRKEGGRLRPRPWAIPSEAEAIPAAAVGFAGFARSAFALAPLRAFPALCPPPPASLALPRPMACASPNDVIVCLCRNGIRPAVPHQASIPQPLFGQSVASSAAIAALHSFGWQFPADSAIPAQKVPTFCVVRQTALPAGGQRLPPLSSRLPIPIG